jgi:heme exporter protein B
VRRFVRQTLAIARKDLLLEMRSRERIVSMGVFAILVAVVFSFALDPTIRARGIAGAMIWVTVLFAGTLGLGRSFAMEREQEALSGLLLAPMDRSAIFWGKFLANLAIVLVVEALIFPTYALFFQLDFTGELLGLVLVVFLATVGFMALGTLFSAITAHTRLGDTLLPVLLLPMLLPIVIFASGATQRLLIGRPLEEITSVLRMLLAFDLVALIICTLVFSAVLEE